MNRNDNDDEDQINALLYLATAIISLLLGACIAALIDYLV